MASWLRSLIRTTDVLTLRKTNTLEVADFNNFNAFVCPGIRSNLQNIHQIYIEIITVRLPVPGHFYSCVVSKYLLRENEISFSIL